MEKAHPELEYWVKVVTEEFYEIAYKDEWLKDVFKIIDQKVITFQQIAFMIGALGGEKKFSGQSPATAHPHIYIDEEMWQRREDILLLAMKKVSCPEDLIQKWLKVDNAFKRHIVMKDPSECQKRFFSDEIVIVPNPRSRAA